MTAAAMGRDAWKPEQPGGFGVGAVMALLAHAVLVAVLAIGVNWRSSPPNAALSAELWSAVPEVAAPKPVEPPPQPKPEPTPPPKPAPKPEPDPRIEQQRRDAQIAIEKAEREKKRRAEEEEKERAEKLKAEKLKAEKLAAEKAREEKLRDEKAKKEKLDEERKRSELAAKLREQQLARMRDLAGATGSPTAAGNAQRDAAPSAGYAGRIRARIKPKINFASEVSGNPRVEVEVRCAPDGRILDVRVVKPSGSQLWDDAVVRAVRNTEVLPLDTDGRIPSSFVMGFVPRE